jgi:predicted metal-dependent hydrolase
MSTQNYTLKDINGDTFGVSVQRDKRLKKSFRWHWQPDGTIQLRVPHRLPKGAVGQLLDQIAAQLQAQRDLAARRTDAELQQRAEYINKKYFGGRIKWKAIRWVSNMNTRLGSCTNGGSTDGHIRISDKIKGWPPWVVDAVIAHELVHRLHNSHSQAFWDTLKQGYPLTEKAQGFIEGVGFAEGKQYQQD